MSIIYVTDREGGNHKVEIPGDDSLLMEILRDEDLDVEGVCGGQCACGTCHVYIDPEWEGVLPPMGGEEEMMLEAIGEIIDVRPSSRLSCQIEPDDSFDGIHVEIAPEF